MVRFYPKHANVVPRHKLKGIMETEPRFWKRKPVSVSRFHSDPFTYVVIESGNGNVFPFPLLESLSVVNSGQ